MDAALFQYMYRGGSGVGAAPEVAAAKPANIAATNPPKVAATNPPKVAATNPPEVAAAKPANITATIASAAPTSPPQRVPKMPREVTRHSAAKGGSGDSLFAAYRLITEGHDAVEHWLQMTSISRRDGEERNLKIALIPQVRASKTRLFASGDNKITTLTTVEEDLAGNPRISLLTFIVLCRLSLKRVTVLFGRWFWTSSLADDGADVAASDNAVVEYNAAAKSWEYSALDGQQYAVQIAGAHHMQSRLNNPLRAVGAYTALELEHLAAQILPADVCRGLGTKAAKHAALKTHFHGFLVAAGVIKSS